MLGLMKPERHWQWAAYGKHPFARDYFKVGQSFPLVNIFSDWIEKGYQAVASKKDIQGHCSWRFWTRESRKQNLVCGLVRDSNDSIGRPYPLLIIGTGPLKGWDDQWDLVPFICEKTWSQIEYLSTKMLNDFKKLEAEVQNIRPPYAEWSEFDKKIENLMEVGTTPDHKEFFPDFTDLKKQASNFSEKAECFIYLDQGLFHDQITLISFWHSLFKTHVKSAPNAVFMGGTVEKTYLAFFKRPLTAADFIQLWSVSSERNGIADMK